MRLRQMQSSMRSLGAYANAFDQIDPSDFVMHRVSPCVSDYMEVTRVYPVLTPVRGNLTTERYLEMTNAEFDAYIDAQYGDDDE